jgi:protease-4
MMPERIIISDLFRNIYLALGNRIRLIRRKRLDYVVLRITGGYSERTQRPHRRFPLSLLPWPPPPPSIESFNTTLELLAADPRLRGIVLVISGLSAGPASLSSLRCAVHRFRQSGKQVVAYLHDGNMWSYYLASACDQVVAPESASFRAAGLWSEALFLKDTLALVGIEADFEAIAEYKVSPDIFRRSKMTDPHREMLEGILDSIYNEVTDAIAHGRNMSPETVSEQLDRIPLTGRQALEAGLLDGVVYEDELPNFLGTVQEPVSLLTWDQVRRKLVRPTRWHSRRAIGVISLEGTIVTGPSRQPPLPIPLPLPLPSAQAGDATLVQQLREAAQNQRIAAVVLHVDSPGGSALASDLIWREVLRLRSVKPVVVYMGDRAASGGYYVSAPANAIVAQPTTLTGSIGIWAGKFVTSGLYGRMQARREIVSRGKAAGIYADIAAFDEEERAKIRVDIGAAYSRFKAHVADGRSLTVEQVEEMARGRVWTGEQALGIGLVDELGDLQTAVDKAQALAGLDGRRHSPLVNIQAPRTYRLPPMAPAEVGDWFSGLASLFRPGTLAMSPWEIRIRD